MNYVWPLSRPQEVQKESHGSSSPSQSYVQFVAMAMAILFIHENQTGLPCSYCISNANHGLFPTVSNLGVHIFQDDWVPGTWFMSHVKDGVR